MRFHLKIKFPLFIFSLSILYSPSYSKTQTTVLTPEFVLIEVQKNWDTFQNYKIDFTQKSRSLSLQQNEKPSTGIIYAIKPDKLRLETYQGKSQTIQILNGKMLTIVRKNLKKKRNTVEIWPDSSKVIDSQTLDFLAGKKKLSELYLPKIAEQVSTNLQLKLQSKLPSDETLIAVVSKKSYLLSALITESTYTRVFMEFTKIQNGFEFGDKSAVSALFSYTPNAKTDTVINH